MSGAQTVALVLAALWLAVLSLVVVLLVRQVGLIVVRLQALPSFSLQEDGPEIGSPVPDGVLALFPQHSHEPLHLLMLSATCTPCRELAAELHGRQLPLRTVALVAGEDGLAQSLAQLLPKDVRVVTDPEATALADVLRVRSAPFAVEVQEGTVTGRAYLHSFSDLLRLAEARSISDAAEIAHARSGGDRWCLLKLLLLTRL